MTHKNLKFIFSLIFCAGISFFSSAQIVLTIEKALEIAEENNPNMKQSKLSLERTHFNLQAQRATLKPQFSMNVNPFGYSQTRSFDNRVSEWYTNRRTTTDASFRASVPFLPTDGTISINNNFGWSENVSQTTNGTNTNKAFSNSLVLRVTQPLFTYNRLKMQLTQLEFDYENAGISYALQRLRTEQSITSLFYNVYMAMNNLEISNAELKNAETNYEIINYRVNADLAAKEELYQAEVNLAQARSSVESNNVDLERYKDQLKQTLGMSLNSDIMVAVTIDVSTILIDTEKAIQHGLSSRMELRQREINMELADMQMITVKANNAFSGNVALSLGVMGDNEKFANIYETPTNNPSVSISLSIPIFDWGERKARIQSQKTAQTIALLNYEDEIVSIELAIRQSMRSLNNIRTQIEIQEKQVENTLRTYELNQIRYREGELTGLQMNQYQAQVSNSRTSLARQQIAYKTELLNLKILTLYDFENDEPIVPVTALTNITTR